MVQVKSDARFNMVLARLFFYQLFENGVVRKYGLGRSTLLFITCST